MVAPEAVMTEPIALARADEKAEAEAKLAADKAANCERARAYNRVLTSGARTFTTNERGGRTYMTNEQRVKEIEETKSVIEGCPAAPSGAAGNGAY